MKKVLTLIVSLIMMLTMALPVGAAGNTGAIPAVQEARKGVLRISTHYVDGEQGDLGGYVGTGFLIGSTSGAEYMITNAHVVHFSEADLAALSERVGRKVTNDDPEVKLQVHVKADVTIAATVQHFSEQFDFAILKLSQPIYDRTPLTLYDSENNLQTTQTVYALGFPEVANDRIQDIRYFDTEDVNVTTGIVSKFAVNNNINYILHEAKISGGNSGGPLVDQNGYVVGVNQMIYTDASGETIGDLAFAENYYMSFKITEVTSVLKALGIQYTSVDGGSTVTAPEQTTVDPEQTTVDQEQTTTVTVDKFALDNALTAAGAVTTEGYTEETVAAFDEALAKARSVSADAAATQADVDAAASALTTAQSNLAEKAKFPIALVGGIAAAVVVIIIVVVVVVSSGKKKKVQPAGQQVNRAAGPANVTGAMPPHQQPHAPEQRPPFQGGYSSEGAGATTVLNAGAGETSVLGGAQVSATLIRRKNNETIQISRQLFRIGKERAKVDYCVPDNNSISRVHAHIISKGGAFYIVDQNSTNFTFVNGNKISPNQEVRLNSGDKIKISDEEFEFRA